MVALTKIVFAHWPQDAVVMHCNDSQTSDRDALELVRRSHKRPHTPPTTTINKATAVWTCRERIYVFRANKYYF